MRTILFLFPSFNLFFILDDQHAQAEAALRAEVAREALRPLHQALTAVCRRELGYVGAKSGADLDRAVERIVSKLMARNVMQAVRDAKRRASALENDMSTSLSSSLKHHPIKVRPNPNPNPNPNPSPVKPLP